MIQIEVSTRGLELTVFGKEIAPQLAQKLLERLADVAYASAFFEAPWKSGRLAQSIVKSVEPGRAEISATAPYAAYVENGTRPHEIRPVNARALRFQVGAGDVVFTQLVRHPGTRANPFMQRAHEATRGKVAEVFSDVWRESVGGEAD